MRCDETIVILYSYKKESVAVHNRTCNCRSLTGCMEKLALFGPADGAVDSNCRTVFVVRNCCQRPPYALFQRRKERFRTRQAIGSSRFFGYSMAINRFLDRPLVALSVVQGKSHNSIRRCREKGDNRYPSAIEP